MGAIFGVITAIGLYIMIGVVFAQFAKGHEYPVWVRLFALVAWPIAMLIENSRKVLTFWLIDG